MGLKFWGRNLAVHATLFAREGEDGSFELGGLMEKPAGNFALKLPAGRFPLERDLEIPGDRRVERLNDLGELMLILGGEPWTFVAMTIHELRLTDDRLHARITARLRRDGSSDEETAVLSFKNQKVARVESNERERALTLAQRDPAA